MALIGPAIGGLANDYVGRPAPGFFAAGLSALALFTAFRSLVEPENRVRSGRRGWAGFQALGKALALPTVTSIILLQFFATFCFANLEGTLALFARARLGYDVSVNAALFMYLGFALLVAQGFVVRRYLPKVGELRFNVLGCALLSVGLLGVALSTEQWHAWAALPVGVFGFAMVTTSMANLLSLRTLENMQGEILGVNQASLSMARILGPAVGMLLLPASLEATDPAHPRPFWVAGTLMALALTWAVVLLEFPRFRSTSWSRAGHGREEGGRRRSQSDTAAAPEWRIPQSVRPVTA